MKKYTKNDEFFKIIDTEEKAYWLGAMYADGCVRNDKNIFFTSKDKDWVDSFLNAISYTGVALKEIHSVYKTDCWKANITSKQMFDDLCYHGCVPNKSLILKFPTINEELIPHFIRGYFDGDGTVGEYQNVKNSNSKTLRSGMCSGSKEFLEELVTHLPIKNKKLYKSTSVWTINLSVKDSISFAKYIYNNATVYLSRKKIIFDNAIQRRSETIIAGPKSRTKEYAKQYYHKNKEHIRELQLQYREKKLAYMREYNKRPEVIARRKGSRNSPISHESVS